MHSAVVAVPGHLTLKGAIVLTLGDTKASVTGGCWFGIAISCLPFQERQEHVCLGFLKEKTFVLSHLITVEIKVEP